MKIDGQCHCGQVTYEAEIDSEAVSICHCSDCQALTGSPFRVTVSAPRDAIRLMGKEPRIYEKIAESGRKRLNYFCGECGSPLFVTGEGEAAERWGIRWGSIRQRADLAPKRQIWRRSAAAWLDAVPDLPARERD